LRRKEFIIPNKTLFIYLIGYVLFFILLSCAAIRVPPGGPVDTIPPELIAVTPPSGTIQFSGGEIHLRFSEYMDESTVEHGFRVFPRLNEQLDIRFKGDELFLELPHDLAPNQTYVITAGRGLKDEHGVPLAEPVHMAYSTGSEIARGQISGQVFNENDIAVHLWRFNDKDIDSLFFTKPDYVTDVTDDDYYQFKYLSPGRYQILSIGNEGAGLPLDTKRMRYGLYWKDHLELGENDSLTEINMIVRKEPQPFRLVKGEWNSSRWGRLFFNRGLPTEKLEGKIILITEEGVSVPADFFHDPLDSKNLILTVLDSLEGKTIEIHLEYLSQKGRVILDTSFIKTTMPETPDSSFLELVSPGSRVIVQPELGNKPPVSLIFSKPVQQGMVFQNIEFIQGDSDSVEFVTNYISPLKIDVATVNDWEPNQIYFLQLISNKEAGRMTFEDSLTNIHIQTEDFIGYGNLYGTVEFGEKSHLVVELKSLENPENKWTSVVNLESGFELVMIPEGHYFLMIFEDRDQDHNYTYGKAVPYSPSESFLMMPDTLEIRANWDIDLDKISFLRTF
tara:strand:- start:118 stop:1803 length:1686 start_codon:yes stop_codon:yes gene_type:complete